MIAAFDYRADHCPPRYSVDTYQNRPTKCFYAARDYSRTDVRDATVKIRLKREPGLWSGAGAGGIGVVLAQRASVSQKTPVSGGDRRQFVAFWA